MYGKLVILLAALVAVSAIPVSEYQYDPEVEDVFEVYSPEEVYELRRVGRSLQPGAPNVPQPGQQQNGGWSVNPDLGRDEDGNTKGQIEVNHKGQDHDFNAGWGKVIRGPNKAKPTWHVGGTFRW